MPRICNSLVEFIRNAINSNSNSNKIQIQIQSDELYFVHHAELMIMTI